MKTLTKSRNRFIRAMSALPMLLTVALVLPGCGPGSEPVAPEAAEPAVVADNASQDMFEEQVQAYLRLFPYQETYKYLTLYMQGDPAKLNIWVMASRNLLKAGEDKVVRSNNDTLYKMAWVYLGEEPVVLRFAAPSKERFSAFQLQDDRNANYRIGVSHCIVHIILLHYPIINKQRDERFHGAPDQTRIPKYFISCDVQR
jgi:uncharacterized protein DUF1254